MTRPILSEINEADLEKLRLISTLTKDAMRLFKELPDALQHELDQVHNESTSIAHCLRWGEHNSEELLCMAEESLNSSSHPTPLDR